MYRQHSTITSPYNPFVNCSLQIQQLSKAFGVVQAVQQVSLSVSTGETLALLGPSGCGKSTVLRLIAGLEKPDAGQVHVLGQEVTQARPEQRNIGLVFQDYALFPHMSVLGNVSYGPKMRGLSRQQVSERAREALALVNLNGLEQRKPHQLSGGQQQRVALARALATKSPLLLLDEPLSNLDEQLRTELRQDLQQLFKQLGTGVLLVTHDQREALALADRIAVMRAGQIVQQGRTLEVFKQPATAWVAEFLGWPNILPAEQGQVYLIPEQAMCLGEGQAFPILSSQITETGQWVTIQHHLGKLQVSLSAREQQSIQSNSLVCSVDEDQILKVPDDRLL